MVVAETDYQNFAVLYLERAGQLSVKLYGMWGPASLTRQAGAQALHTLGHSGGLVESRGTHPSSLPS